MSMKRRVIDGLNFVYDSGPQKSYRDGTRHSRWTLVVDEVFLRKFDGGMVPSRALAEADALEVFLPDDINCENIIWEEGFSARVKRVSAQASNFSFKRLNLDGLKNLHEVRGGGGNFVDLDLSCFDRLELASVVGLTDSRLLRGCAKLYELLVWSTDVGKLDSNWLLDCNCLRLLEFVGCSGFEDFQQEVMPSVEFLRVVKPSKRFTLSPLLSIFPSIRSLDLQGVRATQVDCALPQGVELFVVNGKIMKNMP